MSLIDVRDLSFTYPGQEPLWETLSFSIEEGSFTLLLGPNGSGKTALLRHLVYKMKPHGIGSGQIMFRNQALNSLSPLEHVSKIAYVGQSPDSQMISETVWQELAFGLENLGVDSETMRLRIAEIANFFDLESLFWEKTHTLSGGQKQLVNIASALVLKPSVLVLDEADGSLDPIARNQFYAILKRLHEELGISILLCSHNWSNVLNLATQVLYLDQQGILDFGSAKQFAHYLLRHDMPLQSALPAASQISYALSDKSSPESTLLSLQEMKAHAIGRKNKVDLDVLDTKDASSEEFLLDIRDLSFRYTRNGRDVLSYLNLKIPKQSLFFVLGGNGSGKSTLLRCLLGGLEYSGKILWEAKQKRPRDFRLAYLPQNALLMFRKETVLEEFTDQLGSVDLAIDYLRQLKLEKKAKSSPFDLSGGEVQRLALELVLAQEPKLLLLDEPSNNLSPEDKWALGRRLEEFRSSGGTVIVVSHNLDFTARYATHVSLLFQGENTGVFTPRAFFTQNYLYTTEARRIAYYLDQKSNCIISEEVLEKLGDRTK